MFRVTSNLRRFRLEHSARENRTVTIQEVSNAVGISRIRLTNLELGKFEHVAVAEVGKLSDFYSRVLRRKVSIGDMFQVQSINNKRALMLAV